MKKRIFFVGLFYIILIPLLLYSQDNNADTALSKRIILNNIADKSTINDVFFLNVKLRKEFGYSYYLDIDSNRYKNKSIGYIVEDLDSKCKLIGWSFLTRRKTFWGVERSKFEGFEIYLKNSDTTAIVISGYLDYKNYLPSDDDDAFEALLKQKKYRLTFYIVNIEEYFSYVKNLLKKDPELIIKDGTIYSKKYHSKPFPEYEIFQRVYPNIVKDE